MGHTHEDVDNKFSQISEKLRKEDVITIPKLLDVVGIACLIKGMYDIKTWLLLHVNDVAGHSKPLYFQFSRDDEGVTMKYRTNRPWIRSPSPVLRQVPSGQPAILLPTNINKIDTKAIRKNIEKFRGDMLEDQFKWLRGLLLEIEDVGNSKQILQEYVRRELMWFLPTLTNKACKKQDLLITKWSVSSISHD